MDEEHKFILCIKDLFAGELHFDIYAPLF